jgi:hypothetical protein
MGLSSIISWLGEERADVSELWTRGTAEKGTMTQRPRNRKTGTATCGAGASQWARWGTPRDGRAVLAIPKRIQASKAEKTMRVRDAKDA